MGREKGLLATGRGRARGCAGPCETGRARRTWLDGQGEQGGLERREREVWTDVWRGRGPEGDKRTKKAARTEPRRTGTWGDGN